MIEATTKSFTSDACLPSLKLLFCINLQSRLCYACRPTFSSVTQASTLVTSETPRINGN